MRVVFALAVIVALTLTGCGRLRDDLAPSSTPSPAPTQAADVSDLLDEVNDTLDQVNRDLQTGDDAVDKE